MAAPEFIFKTDSFQDEFTVVGFKGNEGISQLYRYEIELKAQKNALSDEDVEGVFDETAQLIMIKESGDEFPVNGMLAEFSENQTVNNYTYYTAVLVPRLWNLSVSKTNEIYTDVDTSTDLTGDLIPTMDIEEIIENVLVDANFTKGTDFVINITGNLIKRDYVCQFRESDFAFISRLMEHEGIHYYFEQTGNIDKLVISNMLADTAYEADPGGVDITFDAGAQGDAVYKSIQSWVCRKRQLPVEVTVRDYNSNQPSLDLASLSEIAPSSGVTTSSVSTPDISTSGIRTEYLYGENISEDVEAIDLAIIRGEELLTHKTRYYAESGVFNLHAGFTFAMESHPKEKFNKASYLTIEVNHEAQNLDSKDPEIIGAYSNTLVIIEDTVLFRPERKTPKPRFYGTMTAFIHAEDTTGNEGAGDVVQMNAKGRYKVHLPFDRADGAKSSDDPDRKASAWIRMATPYVGQDQGMYFPMGSGTEVLLTFINGDPDRPIISAALPNAEKPALSNSELNWSSLVTNNVYHEVVKNRNSIQDNRLDIDKNASDIATNSEEIAGPAAIRGTEFINDTSRSMLPPWSIATTDDQYDETAVNNPQLIKFGLYNETFVPTVDDTTTSVNEEADKLSKVSTDRGSGENYVYANARTFAYPQHERVYFVGTFHEDFHLKDDFTNSAASYTEQKEVFHFPAPGGDADQDENSKEEDINPTGVRGVTEDRRWGDQMFYAWGKLYSWSGGEGDGGSFEVINYGNGTTENLINSSGGRFSETIGDDSDDHFNMLNETAKSPAADRPAGTVPNPYTARNYEALLKNDENGSGTSGNALYEYTIGSTYSYHKGFSLDVKKGNSDSWTWGDSRDYVYGHSCSWVNGDSRSDVLGSSTDMLAGNANSLTIGETTDLFLGVRMAFEVSGGLNLRGGPMFTLDVGETEIGGNKLEAKVSKLEKSLTKLESTTADIQDKQVFMQNTQTVLKNRTVTIVKDQTKLENRVLSLEESKLKIM